MSTFSGNKLPSTARTSTLIADIVRRDILSGRLKPNHPLLERDIALELGVSRTPVREALFVLQGEGLVELEPRRYARVRKIGYSDISQIYSLRAVLEAHSAESAARLADEKAIMQIEIALAKQRNLDKNCSSIEQTDADRQFHVAIAAASNSQILKTVANQVMAFTATLRSSIKYSATQSRRAIAQHKAILGAIKARNPERAAALMSEHINDSKEYMRETLVFFDDARSENPKVRINE